MSSTQNKYTYNPYKYQINTPTFNPFTDPDKSYEINGSSYTWYSYPHNKFSMAPDCGRLQLYQQILAEEEPKLAHIDRDYRDNLNKMFDSPDADIVKFAVGVVKCNTKWLGLYLEAHYVLRDDYIKDIILDEYVRSKHARL